MKKPVSLKDLAHQLNVSISTVSRALNNHPDISAELVDRVKSLAKELNYSPNPLAMGLLKQHTRTIGVIVPDLVTHFYASIISGIEAYAKQQGYFILIASSDESSEKEAESISNLLKTRVEGIIMCLSQETETFKHFDSLLNNEIPLVFFDRICRPNEFPSVVVDNFKAAREIVNHLHQQGCRRIAYINGPAHLNISKERLAGYLQGLDDCNLRFDAQWLVTCNLSRTDARRATQMLLNGHTLPDAIVGINDTVIFAAMKEIKKAGISIPDEIALVGFSGEVYATLVDPELTSVVHPTFEIGTEAARIFFEQLNASQRVPHQTVLDTQLVIRGSSLKTPRS
jgi:DNA-binding LacI/PurR family transcriptional regulator